MYNNSKNFKMPLFKHSLYFVPLHFLTLSALYDNDNTQQVWKKNELKLKFTERLQDKVLYLMKNGHQVALLQVRTPNIQLDQALMVFN